MPVNAQLFLTTVLYISILQVSALEHEPLFPTKNRPARISIIFNGKHNARLGDTLPDVIVQSSDDVYFAVHSDQIASTSTNEFASLILTNSIHTASNPAELSVQESSEVLHGLFCSVYGLPPESRRPSLASVRATFDALQKYGMTPLELYVYQDTFLYKAILVHAHEHAFEAYALAGEYGIEDLAVATSAETIRLEVHTLQSDLAGIMGVSYLYRLYNLHAARDTQLRKILRVAPKVHLAKSYCLDAAQQSIRTTFYSACAKLLWRFPSE